MSDPSPKRGRPRVVDAGSAVTTLIPVAVHDKLIRVARRTDCSVSAVIRTVLTRAVMTEPKKDDP